MLQLASPQPAHHRSQPFLVHGEKFTIILPRRQFQDRTRAVVTSLPSERGEPPQFGVAGLCPRSFPAGLSPLDICGQRCPPPQVEFRIARAPKARCFKQVVFPSASPARTSCSRSRSRSSRRSGTRSASSPRPRGWERSCSCRHAGRTQPPSDGACGSSSMPSTSRSRTPPCPWRGDPK